MFGASLGELSFVAILLVIVLLAQVAPRIGEIIGARFEGRHDGGTSKVPPNPPGA